MRRLGAAAAGTVLSWVLAAWWPGAAPARAEGPDAPPRPAAAAVDYNRDVRPILSESCYQCHGPDKAKRKGGLRLDTRDGAFADTPGGGGPVIVAGKPDESELLARLTSDDPEERMPPPDSGRSLTAAQVDLLRRWVAEGAGWKGHWAFIPPARPSAPVAAGAPAGFVRNDVDRYVVARLAGRGLSPSPEADRVTLARRLGFDLVGLPPTPAEVDAFVNDPSPAAYEAMVERRLASPQFGERMASWWLDLVRYADTAGYHSDNHRNVTPYRDYVVAAFNRDLPFDRFTAEQLAGDLLPGAGDAEKIASGYNRLIQTTEEGGAQAKEYTAKYAADRVRNASTVWLGATLGCAECHDHKFDPFTARDFYRFSAFFADVQEVAVGRQPEAKFPTPAQAARAAALDAEVAALSGALETTTPELAAAQADWEKSPGGQGVEWSVLAPGEAVSAGGATLTARGDGSVLASGANPDRDTYTLTVTAPPGGLTALRLEVLPDGSLPALGPGRAGNGNFVLNEFEAAAGGSGRLAWSGVSATHSQASWPVAGSADGKAETGWAILPETGRPNLAVYEAKTDVPPGSTLSVTLRFGFGGGHALGRFRLSGTSAPRPVRASALPEAVARALAAPPDARTKEQADAVAAYFRSIAPALQPTRDRLAEAKQARADLDAAMPATLVTVSGPPRTVRILPRGNWLDDSGPAVTPAVPAFLKGSASADDPADRRATRLDLARWVASRENPLTARVFVNRLWALLLGQGIVATPDDFGAQGAWPTHPELLDWLAVEFMDSGWDVKHVVRLIATSGTYRQASRAPEPVRQKDPYNQWLARQGRFRLDAEVVRDNALAVSGLLATELGGPSARPYQPAGYWSHLNFPRREYQPDHGDGLYRRGLYTYWCRTFLHPSLLAFDAPSREECTVQRRRSNTPVQALVLLNDPIYVEAARALAERALREGGDSAASRAGWVYRAVLAAAPRGRVGVLAALLEKHLAEYRADPAAASDLIHTGERPVPADLDPTELAAWTSVARVVLNLHEAVTRN